jgi:predicted lipoprotein with Yx(FWY)xxD motif
VFSRLPPADRCDRRLQPYDNRTKRDLGAASIEGVRRSLLRLAAFAGAGVLGVGIAFAIAGPILKSAKVPKLGSIVVNAQGHTLYHASRETKGKIACTGNCVYFWFPVTVGAKQKVVLGKGINPAKVGTIKRSNGTLQVTYNKLPLYRYYLDRKAGQAKGQGFKDSAGTWYVVSTSGKIVTTPAGSSGGGNTGTGSGSTTVSGY